MDIVFLIGRIVFAGILLFLSTAHFTMLNEMTGFAQSKNLPMPKLAVIVSGLVLLLGSLSVLLGWHFRYGALLIFLFLVATAFLMHNFWKIEDPQARMADMAHFFKDLALAGAALMMMTAPGPWAYIIGQP
jgi:uncharacterized membrane protein YphA (DoxX/SURF4 family)